MAAKDPTTSEHPFAEESVPDDATFRCPEPPATSGREQIHWSSVGLPEGVHLDHDVRAGKVSTSVRWPVAVSVDDEMDMLDHRDVTDLMVAIARADLPARYGCSALDLTAVVLESVTFGSMVPVIGEGLSAGAAAEGHHPGVPARARPLGGPHARSLRVDRLARRAH